MHERARATRVAFVSLMAAIGLIAAKLTAGIASGSLAILSEAGHSALDAAATFLTYVAVRIASRPPDAEHPYGHGKAENISALLETVGLFGLSVFIAVQAVDRLRSGGGEVNAAWYTFAVIGLSIVVDANRARILHRVGLESHSPALVADALHFFADLLTSIVVLIGLVFVRYGFPSADAIGSLLIAGYVSFSSISLARRAIDVLMDRAPTGIIERITELALGVEGVEEVRRVRMRYVGGEPQTDLVIAISRRVPLETAHHVTEEVERVVRGAAPRADVIVHVEPIADERVITELVTSIAITEPQVAEVHNVYVTFQEGKCQISLHVKFPGEMTLSEAHSIAESLERQIQSQVPNVSRVDTHLEPLIEPLAGRDVTGTQSTLVAWAKALAQRQPEVFNCHEVIVTGTQSGLSLVMHCEAAPGLSVSEVHNASTRIEAEVHRGWPEVERVTVHFEPVGTDGGRVG